MEGDARLHELAEMTAGTPGKPPTPTALAQAKELLDLAETRPPSKRKANAI